MPQTALPYKILSLARFAPVPKGPYAPEFTDVDIDLLDEAIGKVNPVLYLPLSAAPGGSVTLSFKAMKDFRPKNLVKKNACLSDLMQGSGAPVDFVPKEPASIKPESLKQDQADRVDDILSMVAGQPSPPSGQIPDTQGSILSGDILKEIYAAQEFKALQGAWAGLETLVKTAGIKGLRKIHVRAAAISRNTLGRTLDLVQESEREHMPNLVLIDLGFDNTQPSIDLLEKVADFADKMMVPVLVWIKPTFFRIENFNLFNKIQYVGNHLDDVSYAKFRKLKTHPGASWIMALCNGFAVHPANQYESVVPVVSPVWAAAALCAAGVQESGWPTVFTRYNEFRLENLAMIDEDNYTASTQALFSEDRIMQLVEAGITPVVGMKNKDTAFIPKQASLNGDSIIFRMFFNRIIELLMELGSGNQDLTEAMMKKALENLFIETGHRPPDDISITRALDANEGFNIAFTPPKTIIAGTGKIQFYFT